ncbi:hypothetical protein [Anaerovorax odorimutans]|uniref:hypothetical protein n=1 Tax=Anaerovorax odorimutans TaxID=109327 RepID=UPI00040FD589|nr:hypothetical protein [Anaerovorax odorimutans]
MNANIYKIEVDKNSRCPFGFIRLFWDKGDLSGHYDLLLGESYYDKNSDNFKQKLIGMSDEMDNENNKSFLKELLDSILINIKIID